MTLELSAASKMVNDDEIAIAKSHLQTIMIPTLQVVADRSAKRANLTYSPTVSLNIEEKYDSNGEVSIVWKAVLMFRSASDRFEEILQIAATQFFERFLSTALDTDFSSELQQFKIIQH